MGAIPDIENMVKLGRYFDCSIDYLMKTESDADNDQGINKHNTDVKKQWQYYSKVYLDSQYHDRWDTCFINAVICKMVSGI